MTKVFLVSSCLGKSYADEHYSNLYDCDKHLIEMKYENPGNIHIEQFKSLENRVEIEGGYDRFINFFYKTVESGNYDFVTGWIYKDLVDKCIAKGYEINLIIIHPNSLRPYLDRAIDRGNHYEFISSFIPDAYKSFKEFTSDYYKDKVSIHIVKGETYLDDYLKKLGYELKEK